MFKHPIGTSLLTLGSAMIFSPFWVPLIGFPRIAPSIGQPLCPGTDDLTPSPETRTVELEQFGVRIMIPSNFRTILRNDGSVSILAPGDFKLLQCIAEGMPVQGTDAVTMEVLQLRPNPENLDVKTFLQKDTQSTTSDSIEIQTINDIEVFIDERPDQKGLEGLARGLYQVEGIDGIVEVTTATKQQLFNLLKRTRLLTAEIDPEPAEQTNNNQQPDNLIIRALRVAQSLGYSEESDRETITREIDNSGNLTQSTVTITQEGLLDDSISGQKFTIQFQKSSNDQWELISLKKSRKCQLGRGSQAYSSQPCL